jgi:hypothetical protein
VSRPRLWLAVAGTAVATCLLAAPAQALTRAQANAAALQALKPQNVAGPVIVFGLPKPVKAGQVVSELATPGLLKRPGRKAWLFWEDLGPGQMYEHESIALLVDDRTGRVTLRRSLAFYPLVDGKAPAFLRTEAAFYGSKYHVFSSLPPIAAARSVDARPQPRLRPAGFPPGIFDGDCLLMVVLTPQNEVEERTGNGALAGWSALAASLGIPAYVATAAGPLNTAGLGQLHAPTFEGQVGNGALAANIATLVEQEGCKDIMVYVLAHGAPAPDLPHATTGVEPLTAEELKQGKKPKVKLITPDAVEAITVIHSQKASFKFVIETCYAERFAAPLIGQPNVAIAVASSKADEGSFFNVSKSPIFEGIDPAKPNPDRPEFSHGLIEGMREVVAGGALVTTLVDLIKQGFAKEKPNDRAADAELTHPVVIQRTAPVLCGGSLTLFAGNPNEVTGSAACQEPAQGPGRGRALQAVQITRFDVQLPGKRAVTNYLPPSGFSCAPKTRTTTNDTLSCTGTMTLGVPVFFNIRMSPAPNTGMGASLFVVADGAEFGPFAMTGP